MEKNSFPPHFCVLLLAGLLLSASAAEGQYRLSVAQLSQTRFQQVPGGRMADKVIRVDADYFVGIFNQGVAVIRKGNAYALINAKGETVVPFNQYGTLAPAGPVKLKTKMVVNGLFHFSKGSGMGYINQVGKLIVNTPSDRLMDNGLYFENTLQKPYRYTQWDGKVFTTQQQFTAISEMAGYNRNLQGGAHSPGYRTLTGQLILAGEVAMPERSFSEGLVMVGKKDNFGTVKYGFVDKSGRTVVDFRYSIAPSDFQNGLARVEPADKSSFEYGFINRQGELVWKQSRDEARSQGLFSFFANGLSMNSQSIMDTSFAVMPVKQLLERCGFRNEKVALVSVDEFQREGLYPLLLFSIQGKMNKINPYTKDYGFINLVTGKVIMPAFYWDGSPQTLVFDPVSKLAFAKMITGKTAGGQPVITEGFINEDGEFVILKADKALW